ncbi:MAG: mechanosensitive ion channel family protein, partial [Dokdonella sp.]|nr:mechanosensitive ion channel family protein [Dokdonella sp.]
MDSLKVLLQPAWVHTLLGCLALLLLAWLAGWLARHVLVRSMTLISGRTAWQWDDAMVARGVFVRLAQVVPLLVVRAGIVWVPGVPTPVETIVSTLAMASIVVFLVLALNAALSAMEDLYHASPRGSERSIKGYVQLIKIFVWLIGGIVVIAVLVDRSALSLLAGLGAVSAVLLLIFKDTIMSVVASIQLGTNDMLRVGDWISLPEDNVDG